MARPRVRVFTPSTPEIRSCWTLSDIAQAIRAHEEGEFYASAQLWSLLGRIGRVEGCLMTRTAALLARGGSTTFRVEAPEALADNAAAKALAADVQGWWWSVWPDHVWESILRDVIGLGLAYGTREWFARDGRWFFRLRVWPLEHLRFDTLARKYVVTTTEGPITVEPGDPNWWFYEPTGENSWMRGAVRALGELGHRRDEALIQWARYCKRHGTPILVIEEPNDIGEKEADAFYKRMQGAIAGGTARLPKSQTATGEYGYDIRIVEPKAADAWKTFQAFLDWVGVEVAIRIKGQNLTTEVKGGSFAAATQHGDTDKLLLASDAQRLGTFAHGEVHLWCVKNVPRHDPAATPWGVWDTSEPEDGASLGATMKAVGDGAAAMRAGGMNPNLVEICNRARLPLDKAKPLFELPEPGAEPPAPEGDGGGEGSEGDDPAPEGSDDGDDDGSGGERPPKKKTAATSRVRAAARAGTTGGEGPVPAPPGAIEGQDAIDARVPRLAAQLGAALAPDLGDVLAVVTGATTPKELYAGIVRAYAGQTPEAVAEAMHKALVFAELLGRFTAIVDQADALDDDATPAAEA